MHTQTKTILRWLPATAWMALIFWFSSQSDLPRPADDRLNLLLRKSAHFAVYGVLALCYLWALGDWRKRRVALVLAIVYATSDEYHQSWTPNRVPAWTDVLIDAAGAWTALWLVVPHVQRWITARTARNSAADRDQTGVAERA